LQHCTMRCREGGPYSAPVRVNPPPHVPFIYPILLSSSSHTTVSDIRTSYPNVRFQPLSAYLTHTVLVFLRHIPPCVRIAISMTLAIMTLMTIILHQLAALLLTFLARTPPSLLQYIHLKEQQPNHKLVKYNKVITFITKKITSQARSVSSC
jgi:hypothetical protein